MMFNPLLHRPLRKNAQGLAGLNVSAPVDGKWLAIDR